MPETKLNRKGEVNYNHRGCKMEIVSYRGARDVDVYFEKYDWTKYNCDYKEFKDKNIKCPYEPTVFGIGYLGEGQYYCWGENKQHNKCYLTWKGILERCYDKKYAYNRPTYKDCTVCEEWHNYQNFAKWFEENYYEIEEEKMCLDKDILVKGNKVYSPKTCVFVSERINCLFTKTNKTRGKHPIGVYFRKDRNKFISQCSTILKNGRKQQIYLGAFDNHEDAFYAYKNYKENYIKIVAEEYKQVIPKNLYIAMYNYVVEITD